MRTLLIIGMLWLLAVPVFGQETGEQDDELRSKRGQLILPEAGDFAIGFDAVPLLEYMGNIFNGTENNSVNADFPGNSQQVYGKYFLTDDMAIRARGLLEQDISTDRNRVMLDNQDTPDPNVEVTDEWQSYSTFVNVGGGIEFRKGDGRVVGVFGGEASFLYGTESVNYDYGNPITEGNQSPTSTFGGVNNGQFERIVEEKNDRQLGVGLSGFAGVEYFIAPKLSLGAEFILGLSFIKDYREEETYEYWDTITGSTDTRRSISEGGHDLLLRTTNSGGSINLMFYF